MVNEIRTEAKQLEIQAAGEADYKAGKDLNENPYRPGTHAYDLWANGWYIGRDTDE